jgi:hypothetical protein
MSGTPPISSSATTTATTTARSSSSGRHLHNEDLLLRTWRSIAHSVAIVINKAEKVSVDPSNRDLIKELNEATVGFLRNHMDWGRSISYLEAKLEGKAAEKEALQHYARSHPCMRRKRQRRESTISTAADTEKPAADIIAP